MPPTIMGPRSWCTCASAPRFRVGTPGLYSVELAEAPPLMADTAGRCRTNYFFGGDAGEPFATGQVWQVPEQAWQFLRRAGSLYYRVVAVDQRSGTPVPSVADGRLDSLPSIELWPCRAAGPPAWSRPVPRPAPAARPARLWRPVIHSRA